VVDNVKADVAIQPDTMGGRSALPLVVPPVEFSKAAKPWAMRREGWLDGLQVDTVHQWVIHQRSAHGIDHHRLGQDPDLMAAGCGKHGSKPHFRLRARFRGAGVCRKQHLHHSDLLRSGSSVSCNVASLPRGAAGQHQPQPVVGKPPKPSRGLDF
jgi:hypothetical protein